MANKKMGRPLSPNPKTMRVSVRLTVEEMELLDEYCQKEGVSHPQGLRDALHAFLKK